MTDAIAWALVHFLWQGTALALVAALLMRLASAASVRYIVGVAALAAMVLAVGLTAARTRTADLVQGPTGSTVHGSTSPSVQESSGPGSLPAVALAKAGPRVQALPTTWIFTTWILGVLALSVRSLGGWWVARRVARDAVTLLSEELQAVARALAERLAIRRVVGVFESSHVAVPVMIGWLRPVVLMPPAALSGLSIAQVEAILAHEFAHIRRHDYLVNLLQTAVETALFFHPAVWWLSREIRRERELCCDDLAVSVSDRLTYATALSALAHLQPPSLALAATDGSLRDRVRRIISTSPSSESAKGGWMAMLPLLLVVSLAAPAAFAQVTAVPPETIAAVVQQTVPSQPNEPSTVVTPTRTRSLDVTPQVSHAPVAPSSVARPALPVVTNYFMFPTPGLVLQAPPPPVTAAPRIAASDVVRIDVFNLDNSDREINRRYVVGPDGTINVKYLGSLPVAGLTIAEVERTFIREMTAKQIYPPGILSVVAKIADDRYITVLGHVGRPGEKRVFPEEMMLTKAIAASGGLLPSAGEIQIRRQGVVGALTVTRAQLLAGADLSLIEDDVVTVRQAMVFFVTGQVLVPGPKPWEPGMTVLKATALAGGLTREGKYGHIARPVKDERGRIVRYTKIDDLKGKTEILPDDQLIIAQRCLARSPADLASNPLNVRASEPPCK